VGAWERLVAVAQAVWLWLLVLCFVAGLGGLGWLAWGLVMDSPFLELSEIQVVGGSSELQAEVRELIGLRPRTGVNLLMLSAGALTSRVESHPRVRWALVQKEFPGLLQIMLEERRPAAILTTDPMFIIDRDGVVIDEIGREGFGNLPPLPFLSGIPGTAVTLGQTVNSPDIHTMLRLHRTIATAEHAVAPSLVEITRSDDDRGFQLLLKGGRKVTLGRRPSPVQLVLLDRLLRQTDPPPERLHHIDLRYEGQMVYTLKESD
jgi:cell division septal protein FtsQ